MNRRVQRVLRLGCGACLALGLGLGFVSACGGNGSESATPPAEDPGTVACTMDVKICPDGSAVGRVAPRCEFALCPGATP